MGKYHQKYDDKMKLYALWELISPLIDQDKDWIYNAPKEEADAIIEYAALCYQFLDKYGHLYDQNTNLIDRPSEKEIYPYFRQLMEDPYWKRIYDNYTSVI